jgi:hypothetical protein
MIKEEIKALLTTEEGKAVLKEITDGLQGNRDEILREKKKLRDSLEAVNSKLNELETERETLKRENFNLVVDGRIDKVLDEIKVAPQHRRAVRALLRSETLIIKDVDGERVVLIGKGDKAQPLETWAATWAASEEGKAYVSGPVNHGGGAAGSHEGGSSGFDLAGATPEQILENLPKLTGGKR